MSTNTIRTYHKTKSETLLGIKIEQSLKWKEYVLTSDYSLVSQLNTRLNALKKLTFCSSFKIRLMIANGIFISKLIYMIHLWGGCEKYLIQCLQIIQNSAARTVTRRNIFTPVEELLRMCNWLSVSQLVSYHTLMLVFSTLKSGKPEYLSNMFSTDYCYQTRFSEQGNIRAAGNHEPRLEIMNKSFKYRGMRNWNILPTNIKTEENPRIFKHL